MRPRRRTRRVAAEADYNGGKGTVAGTKNYTYVTAGGQSPEVSALTVGGTVYRSGQKVGLTEEQHAALVRDGHVFKEDVEAATPEPH
jgi:hypothetical protein